MAARTVLTSNTLEEFRTTFNSLSTTDIGDTATLTTTESNIVGAINELDDAISGDLVVQTFGHTFNGDGSNTYTSFIVTVDTKTSSHIYFSTDSGHPLLFYYDAAKTTQYSTGVTTSGTPGSSGAYTEIVVSETTPNILYYQCSVHGYMGSRIDIESSRIVAPSFVDTTGTTINYSTTNFAIAQAVALG